MLIKIIVLLICMELWRQGGKKESWLRDVLIPIILGTYIGFKFTWWLGLLSIGSFNIIRIGYGIPDENDKGSRLAQFIYNKLGIKIPYLVRGMAGLIYGLIGGINAFIYTGTYIRYTLYIIINCFVNLFGEKFRLNVEIMERMAGLAVGSLILFI